jgi:hypothetical protein
MFCVYVCGSYFPCCACCFRSFRYVWDVTPIPVDQMLTHATMSTPADSPRIPRTASAWFAARANQVSDESRPDRNATAPRIVADPPPKPAVGKLKFYFSELYQLETADLAQRNQLTAKAAATSQASATTGGEGGTPTFSISDEALAEWMWGSVVGETSGATGDGATMSIGSRGATAAAVEELRSKCENHVRHERVLVSSAAHPNAATLLASTSSAPLPSATAFDATRRWLAQWGILSVPWTSAPTSTTMPTATTSSTTSTAMSPAEMARVRAMGPAGNNAVHHHKTQSHNLTQAQAQAQVHAQAQTSSVADPTSLLVHWGSHSASNISSSAHGRRCTTTADEYLTSALELTGRAFSAVGDELHGASNISTATAWATLLRPVVASLSSNQPQGHAPTAMPLHTAAATATATGHHHEDESVVQVLEANTKLYRSLKLLDQTPSRECHKVGVIYVALGQDDQNVILRNTCGSPAYEAFVDAVGCPIDVATHMGFLGGLDPYLSSGRWAPYFATSSIEVIFHVVTRMPTLRADRQQVHKKRHVSNDHVQIIWSEHDRDYLPSTFVSHFNDVHIVIYPQPSGLYRVQIFRKEDKVPLFGPLQDGMVVEPHVLVPLVRATAICANRAVRSTQPGYIRPYPTRDRYIAELVSRHAPVEQSADAVLGAFVRGV